MDEGDRPDAVLSRDRRRLTAIETVEALDQDSPIAAHIPQRRRDQLVGIRPDDLDSSVHAPDERLLAGNFPFFVSVIARPCGHGVTDLVMAKNAARRAQGHERVADLIPHERCSTY